VLLWRRRADGEISLWEQKGESSAFPGAGESMLPHPSRHSGDGKIVGRHRQLHSSCLCAQLLSTVRSGFCSHAETMARISELPNQLDPQMNDAVEDRDAAEDLAAARSERRARLIPPTQPQLKLKMLIAPLLMLGGKKLGIDYALPEILSRVRFAFVLAMTLCLSACALMYAIVKRKKKKLSENRVEVRTKDPMAGGKEKVEILTHFEHDVREIGKAFTNQLFGFGVVGAMHVYMKVNPPLLLQVVTMPMSLWDTPVFQVHFLGKDEKSSARLTRPWKPAEQANPFTDLAKAFNGGKISDDGDKTVSKGSNSKKTRTARVK
jgi:hypothetical protein